MDDDMTSLDELCELLNRVRAGSMDAEQDIIELFFPAQTTSSGLRDRGERETILMYEDALGRIITEDREEHTNADGPCAKIAREAIAKSAAVPPQNSDEAMLSGNILQETLTTLRHARTFITSREKMHPDGVQLYDKLYFALAAHVNHSQEGTD
jgi:hypothetical protein